MFCRLEELIASLEAETGSAAISSELGSLRLQLRAAIEAQQLAAQLKAREELLAKLAAQGPLVVYGSALLASVASTGVMHPVDTFKTLSQASSTPEPGEQELSPQAEGAPSLRELYRGLLPNLAKEGPSSALYLGVYEACKDRLLATQLGGSPLLVYLLSGAAGEMVGSVVRAPSEAAKARLQSGLAKGPTEAVAQASCLALCPIPPRHSSTPALPSLCCGGALHFSPLPLLLQLSHHLPPLPSCSLIPSPPSCSSAPPPSPTPRQPVPLEPCCPPSPTSPSLFLPQVYLFPPLLP